MKLRSYKVTRLYRVIYFVSLQDFDRLIFFSVREYQAFYLSL